MVELWDDPDIREYLQGLPLEFQQESGTGFHLSTRPGDRLDDHHGVLPPGALYNLDAPQKLVDIHRYGHNELNAKAGAVQEFQELPVVLEPFLPAGAR